MSFLREDKSKKPDFTLIPYDSLARVAFRFMMGAEKYDRFNWRLGDVQTYKESMLRHAHQYVSGDSSEDHLSAVAVNAMIIMWLEDNGLEESLHEQEAF